MRHDTTSHAPQVTRRHRCATYDMRRETINTHTPHHPLHGCAAWIVVECRHHRHHVMRLVVRCGVSCRLVSYHVQMRCSAVCVVSHRLVLCGMMHECMMSSRLMPPCAVRYDVSRCLVSCCAMWCRSLISSCLMPCAMLYCAVSQRRYHVSCCAMW